MARKRGSRVMKSDSVKGSNLGILVIFILLVVLSFFVFYSYNARKENLLLKSQISSLSHPKQEKINDDLKEKVKRLTNEKAELNKENITLKKETQELKRVSDDIKKENNDTKKENSELKKGNSELKKKVEEKEETIADLTVRLQIYEKGSLNKGNK